MQRNLKKLRDALRPLYGERETEAIIRLIFHHLKGWSLTDMLIHREDVLSDFISEEIDRIITRLQNFEPIQYITREARFHGMDLIINPGVLIPRRETEELTDLIIKENEEKSDLNVLDICTGSGCIAITLSRNLKFPKITAIDNSEIAIDTARKNVEKLKCKIKLIEQDIFETDPEGEFDIIVSNPPYVDESEAHTMEKNVLEFEPHEAIFVPNSNPLLFYKRITEIAKTHLSVKGKLYLEINPRHAGELMDLLKNNGFQHIEILNDSCGKKRFIICSFSE